VTLPDGPFQMNQVLACATVAHSSIVFPLRTCWARAVGLGVGWIYPFLARPTRAFVSYGRPFFRRCTEAVRGQSRRRKQDEAVSTTTPGRLPSDRCKSRHSLEVWLRFLRDYQHGAPSHGVTRHV
jgi:hypothetical protein